jgi:hypothetical protein
VFAKVYGPIGQEKTVMPDVRLGEEIKIPFGIAYETLGSVLRGIANQDDSWKGFSLHVDLGDTGLPNVGYTAIPITLEVGPATPGIKQYNVTIRAARHPESFPVFEGALGQDMVGRSSSMIWLVGRYDVPLGSLGSFLDASVARGVAEKALRNFLCDIAGACVAYVEKREADFMRFAHHIR